MEELFEFEVHKKDGVVLDSFVEEFVELYLDKNSLFWGGGYDLSKINGVISTYKENSIDLNLIISDFVSYFSPQDKIIIKVYESWFNKIDSNSLVSFKNVDLTKIEDFS